MSNTDCSNCYHWDSYCISRIIPQNSCIWFVDNEEVYRYLIGGQAVRSEGVQRRTSATRPSKTIFG
ncbi:MAG: hypothetical protein KGI30_11415 [Planctomycetota bacterium]|nr:hypothetical protein [Planctomycetota bacterium]